MCRGILGSRRIMISFFFIIGRWIIGARIIYGFGEINLEENDNTFLPSPK